MAEPVCVIGGSSWIPAAPRLHRLISQFQFACSPQTVTPAPPQHPKQETMPALTMNLSNGLPDLQVSSLFVPEPKLSSDFQHLTTLVRTTSTVSYSSKDSSSTTNDASTTSSGSVNDVLCARGRKSYDHVGNVRFRALLREKAESYSQAKNKFDKSLIVTEIMDTIHNSSPPGRFVKKDKGEWVEITEYSAREKVGQGFRDLLDSKYKSSTKAKKRRRNQALEDDMNMNTTALLHSGAPEPTTLARFCSEGSSISASSEDLYLERIFCQANRELLQRIKEGGARLILPDTPLLKELSSSSS